MSLPDVSAREAMGGWWRAPVSRGLGWLALWFTPTWDADRGGEPLRGRDPRLDMFRGLALVMIFINHVPGTIYENFTNRNFGFSDAAEAFVFMSGMAAGLASSGKFITANSIGTYWTAIARVWARARQLYFVHLTITLLALGIFAFAALQFGMWDMLDRNNVAPLFAHPAGALIGIPTMMHQLGYLNILPLYITLLLATPLLLVLGIRWPVPVVIGSVVLWAVAGQFRLNLPNFPTQGGWFFNPFSWQLIFVIGLLSGVAMKRGQRFAPQSPLLLGICAAFVVFVLIWVKSPPVADVGLHTLGWFSGLGLPFYITWFDKTFLALPRLLHALAVFYLLGHLEVVRRFAGTAVAAPLRLLGRQGLPVFATCTVLSMALQTVKTVTEPDPVLDGLMLGSGLVLLWALAWALTKTAELKGAAR
jgi:hypothetical protein